MIDTLARHFGFLTVLLADRLSLAAFVRVFVQVFVRASTWRVSGFLGFGIDKDASLAIVAGGSRKTTSTTLGDIGQADLGPTISGPPRKADQRAGMLSTTAGRPSS
jgi:hypothetical protein